MKIAILGTRGIPNNYGGPEANAEFMSPIFRRLGHEVTVYSPDEHPYQAKEWHGIRIKHVFNQEKRLRIWGTLLYDFLCLRDALASDYDVILELGYVPVAIFYPLFRRRRIPIVTNMDGLEWKRSKWNAVLQRFALLTERLGAQHSDALIADNEAIQTYLLARYRKQSRFIAYGAKQVDSPSAEHLNRYGLVPQQYFMLIARMEPENSIETILDGYVTSNSPYPFVVVGNPTTRFGQIMVRKYSNAPGVRFVGGIYDYDVLSSLRWQARLYFHGHSVGGTNPSLVEAMASNAFIAAHDNPFNRSVLEDNALYFKTADEVRDILRTDAFPSSAAAIANNLRKVDRVYNWERIAQQHLALFEEVLTQFRAGSARTRG